MPATRYLITGVLRTISPLSIRSGLTWFDLIADRPAKQRSYRAGDASWHEDSDVALVMRAADGLPYVPGSALKGAIGEYIRRLIADGRLDKGILEQVIGREAPGETDGRGGSVYFYDAFVDRQWLRRRRAAPPDPPADGYLPWWDERALTYIEASTAIDGRTRAAAQGLLRFVEAVPADVEFRLEILVDSADQQLVRAVLDCLHGFNLDVGKVPVQLGSETADGWGQCGWAENPERCSVARWTPDLRPSPSNRDADLSAQIGIQPSPPYVLHPTATPPSAIALAVTVDLELHFDGPFLVNDGSRKAEKNADARSTDRTARLTRDGKALLPAGSFRGSFRSQIERIIRTLAPDAQVSSRPSEGNAVFGSIDGAKINEPLRRFLGTTGQQSGLWISDFVGSEAKPIRRQEHVAIDRWTQGAATALKFNVGYVESPTLRGTLRVVFRAPDELFGVAGLLVLALRDLCEGDIGFGTKHTRCTASILNVSTYGLSHAGATPWHAALDGIDSDEKTTALFAAATQRIEQIDQLLDRLLSRWREPILQGAPAATLVDDSQPSRALSPGAPALSAAATAPAPGFVAPTSFINPYHFVPLPDAQHIERTFLARPAAEEVLIANDKVAHPEAQHLRHDRYLAGPSQEPSAYSGRIVCRLTTKSPCVFGNEHEPSPDGWGAKVRNYELDNRPAIAASTLRGCIGTLMELISGSSMRVLVDCPMSLRTDVREARVPIGMIYEQAGERFVLPLTMPPVESSGAVGKPTTIFRPIRNHDKPAWYHVISRTALDFPVHLDGYEGEAEGHQLRRKRDFLAHEPSKSFSSENRDEVWWLAFDSGRTPGFSIQNNGRELIANTGDVDGLYSTAWRLKRGRAQSVLIVGRRAADIYRGSPQPARGEQPPACPGLQWRPGIIRCLQPTRGDLKVPQGKRHEIFIPIDQYVDATQCAFDSAKCLPHLIFAEDACNEFERLAELNREAHGDGRPIRLLGQRSGPLKLRHGDLVHFRLLPDLVDGKAIVQSVAISAIWREDIGNLFAYFGDRKDLLPWNSKRERISPVEQLLGFVESRRQGKEAGDESTERLTAYASRIQFSAARWMEGEDGENPRMAGGPVEGWYPLKILSSPKPPCPELYFSDGEGEGVHGRDGLSGAEPRGWKIYLHDPAAMLGELRDDSSGWRRSWETTLTTGNESRKDQKMLVQPLKADQSFVFHVDFDNLRSEELALVLKALKPAPAFVHKLGLGKPIGLGSIEIDPVGAFFIDRWARYWQDGGLLGCAQRHGRYHCIATPPTGDAVTSNLGPRYAYEASAALNSPSQLAWTNMTVYNLRQGIAELLDLIGNPVHVSTLVARGQVVVNYPFRVGAPTLRDLEEKLYEWFVQARRAGASLKRLRQSDDLVLSPLPERR